MTLKIAQLGAADPSYLTTALRVTQIIGAGDEPATNGHMVALKTLPT